MVHEAGLAVEVLRRLVGALDFEVEGAYPARAADLGGEAERDLASAAPAELVADVQLVDEGVAPAELEAEAEGKDEIAGDLLAEQNQVRDPERVVGEELRERPARRPLVEARRTEADSLERREFWQRVEPPTAEAGYVILVTTAPRGTIPADLWRKSHVVHL